MDPNIYLNQFSELTKQLGGLSGETIAARDKATNDLKTQYGYDDRVKTLDRTRQSITDAENLISSLPANLRQRTAGKLVTQGQLERIQGKEMAPLAQQLGILSSSYGTQQAGLGDVNNLISNAVKDVLDTYKIKGETLGAQQSAAWNQYLSAYKAQQDAWQQAFQQRQLEQQQRLAEMQYYYQKQSEERQINAQKELQNMINSYNQQQSDRQAKAVYDQMTAQKKKDLSNALSSYAVPNQINIDPWDYLGLGLGISGSNDKLKAYEDQQGDINSYKQAIKFMQDNYDKGASYVKNVLSRSNNPYAYLVDTYF